MAPHKCECTHTMLVRIASIHRVIFSTCIRGVLGFCTQPLRLLHVDVHVQYAVQESGFDLYGVEFGHGCKYFAKIHTFHLRASLGHQPRFKPLASFFMQNTHLHFMALRPFGNGANSHIALTMRYLYSSCIANSRLLASLDSNAPLKFLGSPTIAMFTCFLSWIAECGFSTISQEVCVAYPDT